MKSKYLRKKKELTDKVIEWWPGNLFFNFRIFTVLAVFFVGGIFAATFFRLDIIKSWPAFLFTFLALILIAFLNFILKNRFLVLLIFGLASFLLALAYYSYFSYKTAVLLPFGEEREIVGEVVKKPEKDFKVQKLVVRVNIDNETSNLLVKAPIYPDFFYGQKLKFTGKIEAPQNFGEFDYINYLKRQLIFGLVNMPSDISVVGRNTSLMARVTGPLFQVSVAFEKSLNRSLPEPEASLAGGLILGIKRNIPDSLIEALKKTGLTHIIALSGFNVTIIVVVISALLGLFLAPFPTFWLSALLAILFVILSGGAASIVRAAIFSLLLIFGKTIGRRADQTNLMLLAAVVMIIQNPYVLRYDLGFQLSFLAFAGLIYLAKPIADFLLRFHLPDWLRLPFAETLGAQAMVTPLILGQFGTLSLISPIANLLVVWIVPYAMAFVFAAGLLGIIYAPLGQLAGYLSWPLLAYIVKMVEWLAAVPWAAMQFK